MQKYNAKSVLNILVLTVIVALPSCATVPDYTGAQNDINGYKYRLGPEDVIDVQVENHPEWSGEYKVRFDGKIKIPQLGEITVENLTRAQCEGVLTGELARYIKDPIVTVEIKEYESEVIYVLGEVKSPGRYPTKGRLITLRDAIIAAELPLAFAATDRVFVITPSRENPRKRVVNLERVLYNGELKNNIILQPGDIVYVPKTITGIISDFLSSLLSPFDTSGSMGTITIP